MMPAYRRLAVVLLLPAIVLGCSRWQKQAERKSPLAPATMTDDSVALDIFFVEVPFGDEQVNRDLWTRVDEQHLPVQLRRDLAANGLRAGIVGGRLPPVLERLLQLEEETAGENQTPAIDLVEDSPVRRRHLQTRKGQRNEVLASDVVEEMSLLRPEGEQIVGHTYERGQGIFACSVIPQGDGSAQLTLVPEVHYGDAIQRLVHGQGRVRIEPGRSREVFEDLTLNARLAPGQFLIVASLPDRLGSLGHHFLSEEKGGVRQQRLLLIRHSQSKYDDRYKADAILP